MPWLAEDRERLARFRQGDRTTLSQTYNTYVADVSKVLSHGFLFNSAGNQYRFAGFHTPFDLDDALQETFLRAFSERTRLSYDGVRPFGAYLATIARHVVIDGFRKRERAERACVLIQSDQESTVSEQEKSVLEAELRQILARFKASRTEEERQLIALRLEQRIPRAKVSEQTGLTAMQIRTREAKLLRALYETLCHHGFGPDIALFVILSIGGAR